MLTIVQVPDKVLTSPTRPVTEITKEIRELVFDMEETLIAQTDPQGVGLAATQVGVALSLFIMKPAPDAETEVCINPKILKTEEEPEAKPAKKGKQNHKLEGCLSIPRIWGPVRRAKRVHMEYQDLTGQKHVRWFTGFRAVIVQHECDHLKGVLFTQRALENKLQLYEEKDGELEPLKY